MIVACTWFYRMKARVSKVCSSIYSKYADARRYCGAGMSSVCASVPGTDGSVRSIRSSSVGSGGGGGPSKIRIHQAGGLRGL